ncbi:hypothetical protein SAMD00079811_01640 [Scytonema sp. HK-05]|uniref:hypothetical protein n=1 Tax=Scytonema sp. HK-05 TaxID=1137095 RepID=UPI0009367154|nr:hypothetical protein [Scytonema sp. HK-05]OKH56474.1 hypothetical protein NIES2130_25320 [Scytonema sp. HK-05]BAY42586.1 hypothetical protein SAMD00079811_01640 [Scytonema sp. HK-05]
MFFFQVEAGNALEAALPLLREAEPPTRHSQRQAGNEAKAKTLLKSRKSRFQVLPGNAVGAALPQVSEAEPPTRHSQPEAGNEATSPPRLRGGVP